VQGSVNEVSEKLLYFDNNATTPLLDEVREVLWQWYGTDAFGNPSSPYQLGKKARVAIELAREQVASLVGSSPSEIIFTSCGTESITTAILSACALDPDRNHIVTSATEHSATIKLCEHLARRGYDITYLSVDSDGRLFPEAVKEAIRPETAVVSLLWANNETGVLFPVEEIAAICRSERVPLHLDAVQAAGKTPISLHKVPADFLSLSGHKIHAPKGVGALHVGRRLRFQPLLRGSQENSRRGGTENVASIAAMGCAAELAAARLADGYEEKVRVLRDAFESGILNTVRGSQRNGHAILRLSNTSNLTFHGLESEGLLILLDESGLCCSAGSACTSGSVSPSHVLTAMGLNAAAARSSLRFSFSPLIGQEHISRGIDILQTACSKLSNLSSPGPVAMTA